MSVERISRRNWIISSALAAFAASSVRGASAAEPTSQSPAASDDSQMKMGGGDRLVAFAVSKNVSVIDFAGPWEVFSTTYMPDTKTFPFQPCLVAETQEPLQAMFGLTVTPNYTFENAPQPSIVVVPAQEGWTPAMLEWIKKTYAKTDFTMSVCTGAFILARTGLLDGKRATTHHQFIDGFEKQFPKIQAVRDVRFVEEGRLIATAGETAGMDGAMHIVDRLYGREAAQRASRYMEYESKRWIV